LLAPLVRPAGWHGVNIAHRLLLPFTGSIPRKFARNSSDAAFLAFVASEPLQCHRVPLRWVAALRRWLAGLERRDLGVGPALIVQGRRDTTVDWRYNLPFVQALFPGSEVAYLPDAGHQLANESAEIRRRYLAQVAQYLAARGIALGSRAQA
jgi:lysophospholipase